MDNNFLTDISFPFFGQVLHQPSKERSPSWKLRDSAESVGGSLGEKKKNPRYGFDYTEIKYRSVPAP